MRCAPSRRECSFGAGVGRRRSQIKCLSCCGRRRAHTTSSVPPHEDFGVLIALESRLKPLGRWVASLLAVTARELFPHALDPLPLARYRVTSSPRLRRRLPPQHSRSSRPLDHQALTGQMLGNPHPQARLRTHCRTVTVLARASSDASSCWVASAPNSRSAEGQRSISRAERSERGL